MNCRTICITIMLLILPSLVFSEGAYQLPDIFALEPGNQWTYIKNINGIVSEITESVQADFSSFGTPTFQIKQTSDMAEPTTNNWYQRTDQSMILKGFKTNGQLLDLFYKFTDNTGLIERWNPLIVGQIQSSQATGSATLISFNIDLNVRVISIEPLTVPLGTFNAYKLQFEQSLNASGMIEYDQYSVWVLPYLPVLKISYPAKGMTLELSSFQIKGGTVNCNTDTDGDTLKDYEELAVYHTHPAKCDTDNDGIDDQIEIQKGSDPLYVNKKVAMKDVIRLLKFLSEPR